MTTISLDEQSADLIERLRGRAEAARLPFDAYLRRLAEFERVAVGSTTGRQLVRFKDLVPELEAGREVAAAPLPLDFSREDIYFDHD